MTQYFGDPWPSWICDDGTQVPTPVGEHCLLCTTPIWDGQYGSFMFSPEGKRPVHRECSLRSVVGGIGHLEKHDYWCMEMHDPDGGRDYRHSAIEVWDWVQMHGVP